MKLINRNSIFVLMLVVMFSMIACTERSSVPETQNDAELNLTDDFGGYQATDEQAAFGSEEIQSLELTENADDPLMTSDDVDSIRESLNVDVYSVELRWGNLELDTAETQITDWSGSISIERGAIIALRLIRFERGDFIVRPRTSRQTIEFESHTRPSFDGMLVYIYDPNPSAFDSENSLTFTSTPYTNTFAMHELVDIDAVVDAGNNQFSINGFKIERMECAEGFLEGRWTRPSSERGRGVFIGSWISKDGLMLGHVKGHFGTRDDGQQVLFGKWISVAGLFRGFLRGEWEAGTDDNPAETTRGWLEGDIFNRQRELVGDFSGNWVARERPGNGNNNNSAKHGFFRGQWSQNCD